MKTIPCISIIIIFFIAINLISQTQPHFKHRTYYPESWLGEGLSICDDAFPDTGLFAITDISSNEPLDCYPFHSGHVEGVSDTITLSVHLKNYNTNAYDISSLQPENWFTPVLYHQRDDPRKFEPIADISNFSVSFQYWSNGIFERVTKPQAIPSIFASIGEYFLIYYVWGLPIGRNRLMMKTTPSVPDGFKLLVSNSGLVWVTKPTHLADTLNAQGACFWRAVYADDYLGAISRADSMLIYNQYSIPGYLLRAYAYSDLGDSLLKVTALDSAIAIAERYGDPAVPDTSKMNIYWKLWYDDIVNHIKYYRWKHISGNEKISNL